MIIDELIELKDYITGKCAVNCELFNRDIGSGELPFVRISPIGTIDFFTKRESANSLNYTISIEVVASRSSEAEALTVFEKLLQNLNSASAKGHEMGESMSAEYEEERFIIRVPYKLRLISQ